MKNIPFILLQMVYLGSILSVNKLHAQGAYIKVSGGYGFASGSQILPDYHNFIDEGTSLTSEQVYVSLAKGVNFGGALGYVFNKYIGTELSFSYLYGAELKPSFPIDADSHGVRYTLSSKMLRVIPSLVISSGYERVNPYVKLGFAVSKGTINYAFFEGEQFSRTYKERKIEFNGGLGVGVVVTLGTAVKLTDKISFFGEFNVVNLSYSPTKGEIKKAIDYQDGVTTDVFLTMTEDEKKFKLVDGMGYNPVKLKHSYTFHSLELNAGFRYAF